MRKFFSNLLKRKAKMTCADHYRREDQPPRHIWEARSAAMKKAGLAHLHRKCSECGFFFWPWEKPVEAGAEPMPAGTWPWQAAEAAELAAAPGALIPEGLQVRARGLPEGMTVDVKRDE